MQLSEAQNDAAAWLRSTAEEVGETFEAGGTAMQVLSFVFDVLGFLGPLGIALFFVSLLLLAFVGSFSPLPKIANYLLIVAVVSISTVAAAGFEESGSTLAGLSRYLLFMLVPVVLLFAVRRVFRKKDPTKKLQRAVEELTEQVEMLRSERGGTLPAQEPITIEAQARRLPRRLVRRL
ncbi:hypothetical protein [Parvularcula maris]|uniref:Uncharacterized protein n=1 Tax=Parvularcula maris TaxID=2965077 RepID=A0A9X2LA63_9PROT|nr:hypothetical protein [Parvularcula maris]MCQ8185801.1 hypothetical protein [Parvularcula maris]